MDQRQAGQLAWLTPAQAPGTVKAAWGDAGDNGGLSPSHWLRPAGGQAEEGVGRSPSALPPVTTGHHPPCSLPGTLNSY